MKTNVTIIVVPRERFNSSKQALESIYENTDLPFSLTYIDGGSPPQVKKYLEQYSSKKGFKLIRYESYLYPNQARNIGLQKVNSKYVVFIDNDVVVSPGWLSQLIKCSEDTGASVVGPLTCIGQPIHQVIHSGGMELSITENIKGEKSIQQKVWFATDLVSNISHSLERYKCDCVEFHCVLIRTETFRKIGFLDEKLLNTREHIDFCLMVSQSGGSIYCEPSVMATYITDFPFTLSDLSFFIVRWNDSWELASLQHFRQKWNLADDDYFQYRYKNLGNIRRKTFLKPLIKLLTLGKNFPKYEKFLHMFLMPLERKISGIIYQNILKQFKS